MHTDDSQFHLVPHAGQGIWSVARLRAVEQAAVDEGIDESMLVERAAAGAARVIEQCYPSAARIAILCGTGNNGADGYALACRLRRARHEVCVWAPCGEPRTQAARHVCAACAQAGIPIHRGVPRGEEPGFDLIVDALFGIGLSRPVEGNARECIAWMNQTAAPTLALDIPSGLHADTGQIMGCAARADHTVTFLGLKRGFFTADGPDVTGRLALDDLNVSATVPPQPSASVLNEKELIKLLPPRRRSAHKGCFGRCLIVGGGLGMPGAALLAAHAALRVGAGLVRVATHPQHASAAACSQPEALWHGVTDVAELEKVLSRASCIVVGPGLGLSSWGRSLWDRVVQAKCPLVVDADALTLLAQQPCRRSDWILTPHPKEAAGLLGCSVVKIQRDRFAAAEELCRRYGGVAVLKGAATVIASNASSVESAFEKRCDVCLAGNPGMASAGMGDVLAGILGGLSAQLHPSSAGLNDVARLGVLLHAHAGDLAAVARGERGLLARDVIDRLRGLVNPQRQEKSAATPRR
ncbi:MAG: NAD(P)H-hydrate dehydratase [Myxococcota bacterium]